MTDISFIVVNYNSLNNIKNLLKSFNILFKKNELVKSSYPNSNHLKTSEFFNKIDNNINKDDNNSLTSEDKKNLKYEFIIVDNNSNDGSLEFLEKEITNKEKNIVLINLKKNLGFGKASNIGANIAKGKYLIFLNPDTLIINENIYDLINFFEKKENVNEKIGVIGVKIINEDGSLQYSCRGFPTILTQFYESFFLFKVFRKSKIFGRYFMTWWDHNNIMEVDWVSGSFMFIKNEVFKNIGKFDENYFMYSEDADLCLRLKKEGFKNYYYPFYSIIHLDGAIAKRDPVSRELQLLKSKILYFKKNYSNLYAKAINFLCFIGIINRFFLNFILYIFTFKNNYNLKVKLYFKVLKSYFDVNKI